MKFKKEKIVKRKNQGNIHIGGTKRELAFKGLTSEYSIFEMGTLLTQLLMPTQSTFRVVLVS